jgi:hypothetical protein
MVTIVAYTYEAGLHCPDCTRARAERGGFALAALPIAGRPGGLDEHGVPLDAIDNEDNPVRPIFSTDEVGQYDETGRYLGAHCDTCGAVIYDPEPEDEE